MIEVRETIPYKGVRKMIGKRMEISGSYPMTYQGMYVDVTDLLAFRKKVNAERGAALTLNDFLVKAVSIALQRTPIMNSGFNEDMTQIQVYSNYNISVMTASDRGLVAPVVKETEKKDVFQISAEMKRLIEKANAGKLMPDDYSGGTFGVTNLGKLNSFDSVPLPQPPQPAIMAACTAKKMPVVIEKDGEDVIAVRMMMKLVIGGDHRILDGDPLAAFINDMKKLLEAPEGLLD
ncbi:2-oxo acid dehydrogenase subunit E2 [Oscillibacter sp.]|uniref:2-oxo acid dehydrogenase subunit E2 n=1 Tax=Oscillibacter sp. TaxID=1945593 RepID=UPI002D804166|nr:2-oxo acid dehydrogenase subunit E2 [Oscillibacter sp.]